MEYSSAMKMNRILMHVITQMNLENIMQCERNQTQKYKKNTEVLHDSVYIKCPQ